MRTRRTILPVLILVGAATVSALVAGSATASRPSDRAAGLAKARPHFADWATYHGSGYRGGHGSTMPAVKGALRVAKKLKLGRPAGSLWVAFPAVGPDDHVFLSRARFSAENRSREGKS